MALDRYQVSPKSNLNATSSPTVNDDSSLGYSAGSIWVDTTTKMNYTLIDSTEGAAIWSKSWGTKENPTVSQKQINSLDIDLSEAGYFYKEITSDSNFTFSNATNGQQITLYIKADGTNRNITFPTCAWVDKEIIL